MPGEPMGGLEFLRDYGAARSGGYGDAPDFFAAEPPGPGEEDVAADAETVHRERDYETDDWRPVPVGDRAALLGAGPGLWPVRFVDGKDVGRTVAYVLCPDGYPIPVRLAQIGGIVVRDASHCQEPPSEIRTLRVEARYVERVVSFMADLFPWDEVERFAAALHASGFRLLITGRPAPDDDVHNVGVLERSVRSRTAEEMNRLERLALMTADGSFPPTIVDGRLDNKAGLVSDAAPAVGVIKRHADTSYLHGEGWSVLYALRPGERTPAIALRTDKQKMVTWYVRLCTGAGGPMDGVIRVEVNRAYFEEVVGGNFAYIDRLSRWLCEARTRDGGYSRAAVTLYPVQRAEDLLRARFQDTNHLISRFYRLAGL